MEVLLGLGERRESLQNSTPIRQSRTDPACNTLYNERMNTRSASLLDRIIGEIDKGIKVLTVTPHSSRAPADAPANEALPDADRRTSARLMRVNHAGEVAAQALYQGQALTATNRTVQAAMQQSAAEEADHLAWCAQRLRELQGRTSLLNPFWYVGSFALGALAGALGDRTSLGFVAETEHQVESHLRGHLERLSPRDSRSRAILEQMQHDEMRHAENAASLGAAALPKPASLAMRAVSKLMTHGSYWI
jgi:ubiquinone biosynthesis monooxygenase Coq7